MNKLGKNKSINFLLKNIRIAITQIIAGQETGYRSEAQHPKMLFRSDSAALSPLRDKDTMVVTFYLVGKFKS